MKYKNVGDIRKFERYLGDWVVTDIIKDRNIKINLTLDRQKCPHCGGVFGKTKDYIFNYIEILKESNRTFHLGVSDCGRYIILEEYLGFGGEVSNEIKKYI